MTDRCESCGLFKATSQDWDRLATEVPHLMVAVGVCWCATRCWETACTRPRLARFYVLVAGECHRCGDDVEVYTNVVQGWRDPAETADDVQGADSDRWTACDGDSARCLRCGASYIVMNDPHADDWEQYLSLVEN